MNDEWDGEERRRSLRLINTSKALTEEELNELKALASWSKSARWVVAGMLAAGSFFGIDRISGWFKP